jgi:hypothetical protein
MGTPAQKTRKNLALKIAIIEREITQRVAAQRAGMPEVRLSMIIRGLAEATDEEKKALAKVVRLKQSVIFPMSDEAIAS